MNLTHIQKIFLGFMIFMSIFCAWINLTGKTDTLYNYLFSILMCVIPLVGGFVLISGAKQWKGEGGLIHKGLFFMGVGLLFWGLGCVIWSYYNFFLKISAPYPSLADLGYAPSVFFYCIGASYLSRGAGADLGLRKKYAIPLLVIVPLIMLVLCYYVLVTVARAGVLFTPSDPLLKTITDLAYPIGDFAGLTFSVILSGLYFEFLFKKYRWGILSVLFGIVSMFIADFSFSYATTRGTYFNANISDFLFTLGMFLLAFGSMFFLESDGKKQYDSKLHPFRFLLYD